MLAQTIKKCRGAKDGFDVITCINCGLFNKYKCRLEHCECCGGHCPETYGVLNRWGCVCKKCCIRRSLSIDLWREHKLTFVKELQMYSQMYGYKVVEEALKTGECARIYDEIQKLLILT
jgi:hypothetical protein